MKIQLINIPNSVPPLLVIFSFILLGLASSRLSRRGIYVDLILSEPRSKSVLLKTITSLAIMLFIYIAVISALRNVIDRYGIYFAIFLSFIALGQFIVNLVIFRFRTFGASITLLWTSLGPAFYVYSFELIKTVREPLIIFSGMLLIAFSHASYFIGTALAQDKRAEK